MLFVLLLHLFENMAPTNTCNKGEVAGTLSKSCYPNTGIFLGPTAFWAEEHPYHENVVLPVHSFIIFLELIIKSYPQIDSFEHPGKPNIPLKTQYN